MDINLELYKVFYYVATTLSFSEASRQLFISQSAVSQAVKNLEKKLGHTLFVRSTKRVILTPEGELLLQHVKPAPVSYTHLDVYKRQDIISHFFLLFVPVYPVFLMRKDIFTSV